jgi:hypothetical protein
MAEKLVGEPADDVGICCFEHPLRMVNAPKTITAETAKIFLNITPPWFRGPLAEHPPLTKSLEEGVLFPIGKDFSGFKDREFLRSKQGGLRLGGFVAV